MVYWVLTQKHGAQNPEDGDLEIGCSAVFACESSTEGETDE